MGVGSTGGQPGAQSQTVLGQLDQRQLRFPRSPAANPSREDLLPSGAQRFHPRPPSGLREPETHRGRTQALASALTRQPCSGVTHSGVQGAGLTAGPLQRPTPPRGGTGLHSRTTHNHACAHTSTEAHKRMHTSSRRPEHWGPGAIAAPVGTWPPPGSLPAAAAWLPSSPTEGSRCQRFDPTPAAPHPFAVPHRMNGPFRLRRWKCVQVRGGNLGRGLRTHSQENLLRWGEKTPRLLEHLLAWRVTGVSGAQRLQKGMRRSTVRPRPAGGTDGHPPLLWLQGGEMQGRVSRTRPWGLGMLLPVTQAFPRSQRSAAAGTGAVPARRVQMLTPSGLCHSPRGECRGPHLEGGGQPFPRGPGCG